MTQSNNPNSDYAKIQWNAEGQPISEPFDDVYFSTTNGLEETHFVFLEPNKLKERWSKLSKDEHFVIGETGFGTGLSFLAAWELWRETAPSSAKLHFISVEKHPVHPNDLERALALWPQLSHLSQHLLTSYPQELNKGFHKLIFEQGRINLTLIIDDAQAGLEQLLRSTHPLFQSPQRTVDAWLLDGFTPAKNPGMWQEGLFKLIHQLSGPDTTVATFTAARSVRDHLTNHGFAIEKTSGYGLKREKVHGKIKHRFQLPSAESFQESSFNSPHETPWHVCVPSDIENKTVLIIGAGLAGCHMARALADRGWRVTLAEQHAEPAQEASGNPQGVLYVKLSHRAETLSEFNLAALQFSQRHYQSYWDKSSLVRSSENNTESHSFGQQCGVLQLSQSSKDSTQQALTAQALKSNTLAIALSASEASNIAGIPLTQEGLFFKKSGWLNPANVCRDLIDHPRIQLLPSHKAAELQRHNNRWEFVDQEQNVLVNAETVVLCSANNTRTFHATDHLPTKAVRGQISQVPEDAQSSQLKTVLCAEGYIAPSDNHQHCLGASFDLKNLTTQTTHEEHQQNLDRLKQQFPNLMAQAPQAKELKGRAALRCTTPDYLPLVGPVADSEHLINDFGLLRRNARAEIPKSGRYLPNLFVSTGYGSRGLAYIPLCSDILASQINGEPSSVGRHLQKALNPARFLIRDLIRKKR